MATVCLCFVFSHYVWKWNVKYGNVFTTCLFGYSIPLTHFLIKISLVKGRQFFSKRQDNFRNNRIPRDFSLLHNWKYGETLTSYVCLALALPCVYGKTRPEFEAGLLPLRVSKLSSNWIKWSVHSYKFINATGMAFRDQGESCLFPVDKSVLLHMESQAVLFLKC